MNSNIVLIYDFGDEGLFGNKVFDYNFSKKVSHTYAPICYLKNELDNLGIEFITPDVFIDKKFEYINKKAYIYSNLQTKYTEKIIALGASPLFLVCQESPFVATKFYVDLPRISSRYEHSFVFSGMRGRLSEKTRYHQMFFPESFKRNEIEALPISERKFSVIMNSNKRVGDYRKSILLKLLYGWKVEEIYEERFKLINYFAEKDSIDLFGPGWSSGGKTIRETENIKRIYRGFADDKHRTLQGYKFVFCFENAIFDGYVTEKIFDAMFAGCVPVYLGAPDIDKYIPINCFVDYRKFSSFDEMYSFLQHISEEEYGQYIAKINNYLVSDSFKKFSQEAYSEEIIRILKLKYVKNNGRDTDI